ncbi:MAG: BMC domain-containing protein [bacterium]|nr:BMC domain-containing protein [bacterium]
MSDSAIGLIETRGLIGVLEAADTAAKAADIQLLGVERTGGGLVCVRFRGDTASVQAAVSAASEAVRRVAELVSAHVIPSPAIDIEHLLAAVPAPSLQAPGSRFQAPGSRQPVVDSSATLAEDLQFLPVARLRQLARKTPGMALQGRQISRANKDQLLDALRAVRRSDNSGTDRS